MRMTATRSTRCCPWCMRLTSDAQRSRGLAASCVHTALVLHLHIGRAATGSPHTSAGGVRGADGSAEAAFTQDGRRRRRPHRAARRHQVSGPAACVKRRLKSLSASPRAVCRHAPAGSRISVSSSAGKSFQLEENGCGHTSLTSRVRPCDAARTTPG